MEVLTVQALVYRRRDPANPTCSDQDLGADFVPSNFHYTRIQYVDMDLTHNSGRVVVRDLSCQYTLMRSGSTQLESSDSCPLWE